MEEKGVPIVKHFAPTFHTYIFHYPEYFLLQKHYFVYAQTLFYTMAQI